MGALREFPADIVMALRFFSRLPTGASAHEMPSLARMAPILPFASLIIGLPAALVLIVSERLGLPLLFTALLVAATSAIVTGAMSEDAAADAADGLFGGSTPERRLEILKDSRHGTYGVLAIVFVVGLKAVALMHLLGMGAIAAAFLWLAAAILARSGSLVLAHALPPARASGVASAVGQVSRNGLTIGLVLALAISVSFALPFMPIGGLFVGLLISALIAWGWTLLCRRLVGGQTGDLIGALNALLEIALLSTFMSIV